MKQLVLEINEITEAKIDPAAKAAGLSPQQWLQKTIDEKIVSTWPNSVLALSGAWPDMAFAEELRAAQEQNILREEL